MRVLDFGGGDGTLAELLASEIVSHPDVERVEIALIDPNSSEKTPVDERIPLASWTSLEGAVEVGREDLFDVVLASAIMEHLPEPRQVLEQLITQVRPGGLLYARTPWMAPLARRAASFGVSIDMTFPGHVHDMGGDFWSKGVAYLDPSLKCAAVVSRTSFVESSFSESAGRTLAAAALKLPTRLVGAKWAYCGGWEVVLRCG